MRLERQKFSPGLYLMHNQEKHQQIRQNISVCFWRYREGVPGHFARYLWTLHPLHIHYLTTQGKQPIDVWIIRYLEFYDLFSFNKKK